MGISLHEANQDQNLDDTDENMEAGELKIDTRESRSDNDLWLLSKEQ